MNDDLKTWLTVAALSASIIWNLYQLVRFRGQDTRELEGRITAIETKVGLFWHLVEDYMSGMLAKANPIQLTLEEQVAARIYETQKRSSPTHVLQVLAEALERELPKRYMSADETLAFTLLLGAIKSQLYDRGEWTPDA